MKLLIPELRASLPPLYSQEKVPDPVVHAKFFTPDSNWTWYVTEGQAEDHDSASSATPAACRRNGATSSPQNSNRFAAHWGWRSSAISILSRAIHSGDGPGAPQRSWMRLVKVAGLWKSFESEVLDTEGARNDIQGRRV
jgi:hypothetical protein